jgi:hypothetical protein
MTKKDKKKLQEILKRRRSLSDSVSTSTTKFSSKNADIKTGAKSKSVFPHTIRLLLLRVEKRINFDRPWKEGEECPRANSR